MPNRLEEMMEKYNKTVQQVAEASGFGIDYIYRIKNPKYKERLNENNVKQFADAIGCYPSELLPLEWQKPALQEIDRQILSDSIREAQKSNVDNEEFLDIIPIYYNRKVREISFLSKNTHNLKIDLKKN